MRDATTIPPATRVEYRTSDNVLNWTALQREHLSDMRFENLRGKCRNVIV